MTEKFGRYEIKSEIGRGGMATVFHAWDPRFERDVAIKVLPREFLHDPQFRARFEREAKTIALIEHPAIVPVYDFGEEEGQPFIVMRYMSGGSMAERVQKGSMPPQEVAELFSRLAPALDAAHARGIIHRDLKPGNILYDQYGNAFLSDFGIARLAQSGGMTLTGGNILGTPAYMSPEQVQGDKDIDGRSDIYAMGVILYQLLTGNAPYQATTPARVMMMHILEPVPQLLSVMPNLPQDLQKVIEKAMAKSPDDRFSTSEEMADAIHAAISGRTYPMQSAPDDATFVKPRPNVGYAPPPQTPSSNTGVATQLASPPAVQTATRNGPPMWLFGIIGILLVAIVAGGYAFGTGLIGRNPTEPVATTAVALVSPLPATTEPVVIIQPSATPTETEIPPSPMPTESPTPEATATTEPSPTPSATPAPLILGGADKIAFFNAKDIWMSDLDGSNLVQLTSDSSDKNSLQWLPDGSGLLFITGKCIKTVTTEGRVDLITCFDTAATLQAFEISHSGKYVAISLDYEHLYVVPFDIEKLKTVRFRRDLVPMAECAALGPYQDKQPKSVRWGTNDQSLAFVFRAPVSGLFNDTIRVLDISRCYTSFPVIGAEFPNRWFTIEGYDKSPIITNFGWDGSALFALNGIIRNGGFGDMYIFNTDLNKAIEKVNPIDGKCCYRDIQFSPDGRYLTFAFQEVDASNKIFLYVIPYGTIGTSIQYTPLALPDTFFAQRDASPHPVLRPIQP